MSKETNDQIIGLLKELVKWTKFQAWGKVKDVLVNVLNDESKKQIYHLSDGELSSRNIAERTSTSRSTIIKYWSDWAKVNIVEPISVQRGNRYKKMFNLEDFGIDFSKLD